MKKIFIVLSLCIFIIPLYAQESELQLLVVLRKNSPKTFKNPSEYKLEDGYLYTGANYSIVGGKHVAVDNKINLGDYTNKIVLISGSYQKDLNSILRKGELAPSDYGQQESMQQLRSDWVGEETGFNIGQSTKAKLKEVSYFQIREIEVYSHLSFKKSKQKNTAEFSFTNKLGRDLENITLRLHYETNDGRKPNPVYKSVAIKKLAKGETLIRKIPLFSDDNEDGQTQNNHPKKKMKPHKKRKDGIVSLQDVVLEFETQNIRASVKQYVEED
jgi:hypothetical protein